MELICAFLLIAITFFTGFGLCFFWLTSKAEYEKNLKKNSMIARYSIDSKKKSSNNFCN